MKAYSRSYTPLRGSMPLERKFTKYVGVNGPTPEHCPWLGPCEVWIGRRFDSGYGLIMVGKHARRAHRIRYECANGPLPDGLFALHKCDNRACVRLDHLFAGTKGDNARDAVSKGRWPSKNNRGVANPRARINDEIVVEIRRLFASNVRRKDIAVRLGIPLHTVRQVVARQTWSHVG